MPGLIVVLAIFLAACDHGLAPPEEPLTGTISVHVHYEGAWPPEHSLYDLRFVAMRFVPQDTTDFVQLERLVFSDRLTHFVEEEIVSLPNVEVGPFLYSGVAHKFGPGLFDWRPVGLVEEHDGVFIVVPDETTHVGVRVDFANPPVFPPR